MVRFFVPDGVLLPCNHGLDLFCISLRIQSIQSISHAWRQPVAKLNMDPNRDKILATSTHPKTSETYPRQDDDVFGYELRRQHCCSKLKAAENTIVQPIYQSYKKKQSITPFEDRSFHCG